MIMVELELVEDSGDFIRWLGADMSIKILMCLDNPADLVRASTVSSSWRRFGEFITFCIIITFHIISVTFNCVLSLCSIFPTYIPYT